MSRQQIIEQLTTLPIKEQLDIIHRLVNNVAEQSQPADAAGVQKEAYQAFLKTVEQYQTRYPDDFKFNRDEANER